MKKNTVLFIGPIAGKKQVAPGGFEAANRRTINLLEKNDIHVVEFPYPRKYNILSKIFFYPIYFLSIYCKLAFSLLKNSNNKCICHITPLYKRFIYIETIIIIICKIMNGKVLFDIRAGSLLSYYENRSFCYRNTINFLSRISDKISIEGMVYHDFFNKISGKNPYYFPNYVDSITQFSTVDERALTIKNQINLVYFGRVTPEKGIDICIEATTILNNMGYTCKLRIIGPTTFSYKNELIKKISKNISIEDGILQNVLFDVIEKCHFFIFPTTHKGEGHSNALTEAMAHGCVPICNNNGFNNLIVNDCGIVLNNNDNALSYANAISRIVDNGTWPQLSKNNIKRVQTNFYADKVIDNLIKLYHEL